MKAESLQKPVANYEITFIDKDYVEVEFFSNIQEKKIKENNSENMIVSYVYDYHRIKIRNRSNLIDQLNKNYDQWLKFAEEKERISTIQETTTEERIKILEDTVDTLILSQFGGFDL